MITKFHVSSGNDELTRTKPNPTLCNDPCWKLKVSISGSTKCVSSFPTLVTRIKCPWDCSPGQGLWERLEKPGRGSCLRAVNSGVVLCCSQEKSRERYLEQQRAVTFQAVSAQCGLVLPLGSFHLCIPGQHHPKRMLCPGLGGTCCAHVFVSCHTSISMGWPVHVVQCTAAPAGLASSWGNLGDTVPNWCHGSQCP